MSDYVLPFETAGILLLIALIGAAVIASSVKSKNT
jgi:NADH-quinone oxidoreductase subunit J